MVSEDSIGASATHLTDQRILVLDFGSQYSQLIARRVREQAVYCEIVRHDISVEAIKQRNPMGLILSGGPSSVYQEGAPRCQPEIFELGIPVLGICYGMQLACELLGGKVKSSSAGEYGRAMVETTDSDPLMENVPQVSQVWMSHGDQVDSVADCFKPLAKTQTCPIAAVKHTSLPVYGLQFHPEVTHSHSGTTILGNFVRGICKCDGLWKLSDFADQTIEQIRARVGNR